MTPRVGRRLRLRRSGAAAASRRLRHRSGFRTGGARTGRPSQSDLPSILIGSAMPVIRVDSLDDPRLADYRTVRDPELVRARRLFVAEGRLVVERLLALPRYTDSIASAERCRVCGTRAPARAGTSAPSPESPSPVIYLCRRADFLGLTGMDIHRGCLALVERPRLSTVDEVLTGSATVVVVGRRGESGQRRRYFPERRRVRCRRGAPRARHPAIRFIARRFAPQWRRRCRCRSPGWRPGRMRSLTLRDRGFTIAALTPREPSQRLDDYAAGPRPGPVGAAPRGRGRRAHARKPR